MLSEIEVLKSKIVENDIYWKNKIVENRKEDLEK